jgi:ComF family protein
VDIDLRLKSCYTIIRLKDIIDDFLDFLFPSYCHICEERLRREIYICKRCLAKIKYLREPTCILCGREIFLNEENSLCKECRKKKNYFDKAKAIGKYEGVLKEYIHLLKYKNKPYLKRLLPEIIGDKINWIKDYNFDYVVYVPLHRKRLRKRGYNQAEFLADLLGRVFSIEVMRNNLIRIKNSRPQVELEREKRLKNVKGIFKIKDGRKIKDRKLLLVDDVYTTGATLNECSRELKKMGATNVVALVLARS